LHRINREHDITMLVSSHHIPSTMRMADQVVLLLPNLTVTGTPIELRQSSDPRIAGFFNEDVTEAIEGPEVEVPGEPGAARWINS